MKHHCYCAIRQVNEEVVTGTDGCNLAETQEDVLEDNNVSFVNNGEGDVSGKNDTALETIEGGCGAQGANFDIIQLTGTFATALGK